MKKLLVIFLILISGFNLFGDTKISELTLVSSPGDSAMFYIVYDSSGTNVSRAVYWIDLEGVLNDSLFTTGKIISAFILNGTIQSFDCDTTGTNGIATQEDFESKLDKSAFIDSLNVNDDTFMLKSVYSDSFAAQTVDSTLFDTTTVNAYLRNVPGLGSGSGDFSAASFGDSLANYDGDGITVVDEDSIAINVSKKEFAFSSDSITIKTDGIDDTHIDWGAGANQVNLDDITDGSTYAKVLSAQLSSGIYINATDAVKGIATFNTSNFLVASGDVTIKSEGVNSDEVLNGTIQTFDCDTTGTNGLATQEDLDSYLLHLAFGDSLTDYDSKGLTIVDEDSIALNISKKVFTFSGDSITIVADGIDDTHIDWGTGTNQVSLDDVTDGTSYEKVAATQLNAGVYIDATDAVKGIASFSTDNFTVTSGAVTIKSEGVNSDEILNGTLQTIDCDTTGTNGLATQEDIKKPLQFAFDWPSGMAVDTAEVWTNWEGASITIDSIYATANDTCDINLIELNLTGGSYVQIDSFAVQTVGTHIFYHSETTISNATIESEHHIALQKPTESVDWLKLTIFWH